MREGSYPREEREEEIDWDASDEAEEADLTAAE